jgi:peptidyl-prolyl cis-trans isomerase C
MKRLINTLSGILTIAVASQWLALAAEPASTNTAASTRAVLKPSDLFPDAVVAKGKGVEVKRSQLDEEVIRLTAQAAASGRPIPPDQKPLVEQKILEQLINLQLLQDKATEADRTTGATLADKQFEDMKTQLSTEENLSRQLKAWGATREEVLSKWRAGFVAEAVLSREIKTTVTDAEVKKFYDDQPSKFEQPELFRASHILLATNPAVVKIELTAEQKAAKLKLAQELVKRARAGEDFAKLAKEYTEDPGSKDKGGEYVFQKGQMTPEFEASVMALTPNQVSDVVVTPLGYHIIKLGSKYPAKVPGFEDEVILNPASKFLLVKKSWTGPTESKWETVTVSALIRRNLEAQQRNQQAPDYLAKLRKDAGVEILDASLKAKENPATQGLPAGHPPVTPGTKAPQSK